MFIVGVLSYVFFMTKSHVLPSNISRSEILNTCCIVTSSMMLTGSLFLSLQGVIKDTNNRRRHFMCALIAGICLFASFETLYYEYLYVTRYIYQLESVPNRFADLVEDVQGDKSDNQRGLAAQFAYEVYGVNLAYHRNAGSWTYYVPTQDDIKFRQQVDAMNASLNNLRRVSFGLLYAAVNVVLTSFISFLACLTWATFRRLETDPTSNSETPASA